MISKSAVKITAAAVISACVAAAGLFLFSSGERRPSHILLVSFDALRWDHLGCSGYARHTSPNIDALAGEGVFFSQAVSVSAMTPISLASLFTSVYPDRHSVYTFGAMLRSGLPTLPAVLKKNGFATAGTGGAWFDIMLPGFSEDFDTLIPGDLGIEEQMRQYLRWLDEHKDGKSFLWIHFIDFPHAPYSSPEPFRGMFLDGKGREKSETVPIVYRPEGRMGIPRYIAIDEITDKEFYVSQYDAEIAYADHFLGIILRHIEKLGIDSDTLIVVLSDHGEEFGEHGYYFAHGSTLYDQALRIPLILKFKGSLPSGRVVATQVSSLDIAPTVLDIAGCGRPGWMEGRSLVPLLSGGRGSEFAYGYLGDFRVEEFGIDGNKAKYCVRGKGWKLIYDEGADKYELFDLAQDPGEKNNRYGEDVMRERLLKRKLLSWRKRLKAREREVRMLPDFRERFGVKMKSLGYMQ
jgi:arylsulfatase A-like enzyme